MPQTLEQALQSAQLYTDDFLYRFVRLPANAITAAASVVAECGNPFTALLVDKDEVTLMLEDEDYNEYQKRFLDHEVSDIHYKLITFDVVLDASLVGFIAHIGGILAHHEISFMPFAAFSRDHIFVAQQDFDRAWELLATLSDDSDVN